VSDRKVALVTGATRGVGLALAHRLCSTGYDVAVNFAHDAGSAETAVRSLGGHGTKVVAIRADLGVAADVHRMFDEVAETWGRLDVFVHNAVSLHRMSPVEPDAAGIAADRAVVLGPFEHGAARLAALLPDRTGRVIAISSVGARGVIPGYVSLGTAKAALESYVRYLAMELAGRGVTVNAIAPGKLEGTTGPEADRVRARTPAGRLTTETDVADVVELLCRPEAGHLHGQVVTLDGGLGLWP
jgi:enoyl-[acyl-carrier protein] reductase III